MPPGSFQNETGIDGSGAVSTSSPVSPTTARPSGSNASTLAPSDAAWSSPAWTGSVGTPPTNALQTSVPPLNETSQTSGFTASYTQPKTSGASGEPVEPMARSRARSWSALGRMPAFMLAARNAALVPNSVTPAASAIAHRTPRSG